MSLRTGQLLMDLFQKSAKWKNLQGEEFNKFRNILLEIGDDIVKVCNKYGLKYCLAYGSTLGAVRHKGYIPWDDDLDFFMPRKDYMKFMKVMQRDMGEKYYIRSVSKGDDIAAPTCHIRMKGTKYINYGDMVLTSNEPDKMRGIYIDVAPLDNASDNSFFRLIRGYRCLFILFAQSCVNVKESVDYLRKLKVSISYEEMKQLRAKIMLGKLFSFKSSVQWAKKYDRITSGVRNNDSEYVTCYTGYKKINKSVFKRKDIFPAKVGTFEGRSWNIPNDSDTFLKQVYGDYMTPPPEGQHKIHPVFEIDFGTKYKSI